MSLDPTRLGTLLEPSNRAWAALANATLHHRIGWVVRVEEVKFRAPYCTLVTRGIVDAVLRDFNTEALAKGAFTRIDVDPAREDVIMHVLTNAMRAAEESEQRAKEYEQKAAAERKARPAPEAAERAAGWRVEMQEAAAQIEAFRRAAEEKELAEAIRNAKRVDDWRKCMVARNITRLTHFTRLQNLHSILQRGLWPVTEFVDLQQQPFRNDDKRFDGHLDKVSLSVTHPNDVLFTKWHVDTYKNEHWVVISLEPSVLWELPCLLFPANAARAGGRTAVTYSNAPLASDFEKLFAEPANGKTRAQLGHTPSDTTDPQAEIMVSAKIAPTYFESIGVLTAADLQSAKDIAEKVSNVPVRVDRLLFDMRRCASEYRRAQRATAQDPVPSGGAASMVIADDIDDDIPF